MLPSPRKNTVIIPESLAFVSPITSQKSTRIPRFDSHAEPTENAEKTLKIEAFCRIEQSLGREKKGSILHRMGEAKTARQTATNLPNLRVSAPLREINPVVRER